MSDLSKLENIPVPILLIFIARKHSAILFGQFYHRYPKKITHNIKTQMIPYHPRTLNIKYIYIHIILKKKFQQLI